MRSEQIRTDEVLDLLRRLVEIESPTGDAEASVRVADQFASAMVMRGGRIERIQAPGYGEHLRIDFFDGVSEGKVLRAGERRSAQKGTGPTTDARPLLVVGHLDTVHPIGTLSRLPWRIDGDRLYGPGVFDMKGSWAAVAGALDHLADQGMVPRPLRLIVSCDEEVGAPHSRSFIEEEGRRARGALVLEPPLPGGAMKLRRKGMAGYRIRVRGIPAHAGIEPEKGASAIHEVARLVERLLEWEDRGAGTTINVGTIGGGTAGNVVAAEADAQVELRFWHREDGERIDGLIRGLAGRGIVDPRCSIEVTGGVNRWAMEPDPRATAMGGVAMEVAGELGHHLAGGETGGVSDGQLLAAVGCPVLDGLGIEGGGAHTLEEHLLLSDLSFRIALYAQLFSRL